MLCVSYSHSFLTVQVHFRDVCFIQWQLTYLIVHFTLCVSYSDSTFQHWVSYSDSKFQGCVLYSDSFLTVIVHFSVVFHTVTVHFNVVFHTVTAFLQWQYISVMYLSHIHSFHRREHVGDVSFTLWSFLAITVTFILWKLSYNDSTFPRCICNIVKTLSWKTIFYSDADVTYWQISYIDINISAI